jgi:hypothetical protein
VASVTTTALPDGIRTYGFDGSPNHDNVFRDIFSWTQDAVARLTRGVVFLND